MFGRHPRLAVDACLGIQNPVEPISSREHYAAKLKKRLNFAYKVAAREAQKSANRNNANYDSRVREATLNIGDRVLIRNVGLRGKQKLADKWDKDQYIVIGVPDKNIPVYNVQKEFGDPTVKTLHRNMLLPFSAIPGIPEVSINPSENENLKPKTRKDITKRNSVSESDSNSESDDTIYVPRYIPPHRRNQVKPVEISSTGSAERSPVILNDLTHHETLNTTFNTPSVAVDSTGSHQTDSFVSGSRQNPIDSSRNQSEQSAIGRDQVEVGPRRSGRVRQPPDRYGDWLMNQQSVQEWFV